MCRVTAGICLVILSLLLPASSALAVDDETGMIWGELILENSSGSTDVILNLESEELGFSDRVLVTEAGVFRFQGLMPGQYRFTAEQGTMASSIDQNVMAGKRYCFDVRVTSAGVEIFRNAPAHGIDAQGLVLSRAYTERLPDSDSPSAMFRLAPGVTERTRLFVRGGSHVDNTFMVNGIDFTDPVTSLPRFAGNPDAFAYQEVTAGGFDASIGRAVGGIFRSAIRNGTNEYHGSFRLKYADSGWEDSADDPQYSRPDESRWEPALTVMGPIWKNHIWFTFSYKYYRDGRITSARHSFENSEIVNLDHDEVFHAPLLKLIYRVNPNHLISFSYLGQYFSQDNAPVASPYEVTRAALPNEKESQFGVRASWQWQISDRLRMVSGWSISGFSYDYQPQSKNLSSAEYAGFYDFNTNLSYNNSPNWQEWDRDTYQADLNLEYTAETAWGLHRLRTGADYRHAGYKEFSAIPGGAQYILDLEMNAEGGYYITDAERSYMLNDHHSDVASDYVAVFADDEWFLSDRISLYAGLRYERVTYENDDGTSSVPAWSWGDFRAESAFNPSGTSLFDYRRRADMSFDDMIAPRFRATWDMAGDSKNIVSMFYGRYYYPFNMALPHLFQPPSADPYETRWEYYVGPRWYDRTGPNGVPDGIPDGSFNPNDPDSFFYHGYWAPAYYDQVPAIPNAIDPDLDPEYTDEILLSYDHQVSDNLTTGINYTYRRSGDFIEDAGLFLDDDGNVVWTYRGGVNDDFTGLDPGKNCDPRIHKDYSYHVYWITNVDSKRTYNGIELYTRGEYEYFDFLASYRWSKTKGSLEEQAPGTFAGVAQFSGLFDTWATSQNLNGELPWSAAHYVKLSGSVHYPVCPYSELSLGITGYWHSGFPYSKRTTPPDTYDPDDPSNIYEDPTTWTGRPPYVSYGWYYPEGRGTYDMGDMWQLDLSVQNDLKFDRWGTLTVIFDVLNVFDNQDPTYVLDVYNPHHSEFFGLPQIWQAPRSYSLTLKYAF